MTEKQIRNTILNTLKKYLDLNAYQVFVFGSRAAGINQQWSDYDIGLLGKDTLSFRQLAQIKSDLDDSDLPVFVDVVDFNQVDQEFKEIALKQVQPWKSN